MWRCLVSGAAFLACDRWKEGVDKTTRTGFEAEAGDCGWRRLLPIHLWTPIKQKETKGRSLEGVANRIRSHSKILIKPCMDFIHFQFISSITLFHPGLKPILGRLKKTTLFLSRIKV